MVSASSICACRNSSRDPIFTYSEALQLFRSSSIVHAETQLGTVAQNFFFLFLRIESELNHSYHPSSPDASSLKGSPTVSACCSLETCSIQRHSDGKSSAGITTAWLMNRRSGKWSNTTQAKRNDFLYHRNNKLINFWLYPNDYNLYKPQDCTTQPTRFGESLLSLLHLTGSE